MKSQKRMTTLVSADITDELTSPLLKRAAELALSGDPDCLKQASVITQIVTCQNQRTKLDYELNKGETADSSVIDAIRGG